MAQSSISIPKPNNWQDFETKICELFKCILDDPLMQKNGRNGQPQYGVDIYGYIDLENKSIIGIQCKKKSEERVTESELRSEIEKAKKFTPKIKEFLLTTTAPRDQKIQETRKPTIKQKVVTYLDLFRDEENAELVKQLFESKGLTENGKWVGLSNRKTELLAAFYELKLRGIIKPISPTTGARVFYKEFGYDVAKDISERSFRTEPWGEIRQHYVELFANIS